MGAGPRTPAGRCRRTGTSMTARRFRHIRCRSPVVPSARHADCPIRRGWWAEPVAAARAVPSARERRDGTPLGLCGTQLTTSPVSARPASARLSRMTVHMTVLCAAPPRTGPATPAPGGGRAPFGGRTDADAAHGEPDSGPPPLPGPPGRHIPRPGLPRRDGGAGQYLGPGACASAVGGQTAAEDVPTRWPIDGCGAERPEEILGSRFRRSPPHYVLGVTPGTAAVARFPCEAAKAGARKAPCSTVPTLGRTSRPPPERTERLHTRRSA